MRAANASSVRALRRDGRWLVVELGTPHQVLSWAVVGGGRRTATDIVWREVRDDELRPPAIPERLLREGLAALGLPGAVGLLTSRSLDTYVEEERSGGGLRARCVATVGLGNALRAGDPPGPSARIGTINLLCQLSEPLSEGALVEALAIAVEARTLAVLEGAVLSGRSGLAATGTGTDCVVVAAPTGRGLRYVGKHTLAGHLIGAAVHDAVARGVAQWKREQPNIETRKPGEPA